VQPLDWKRKSIGVNRSATTTKGRDVHRLRPSRRSLYVTVTSGFRPSLTESSRVGDRVSAGDLTSRWVQRAIRLRSNRLGSYRFITVWGTFRCNYQTSDHDIVSRSKYSDFASLYQCYSTFSGGESGKGSLDPSHQWCARQSAYLTLDGISNVDMGPSAVQVTINPEHRRGEGTHLKLSG